MPKLQIKDYYFKRKFLLFNLTFALPEGLDDDKAIAVLSNKTEVLPLLIVNMPISNKTAEIPLKQYMQTTAWRKTNIGPYI